MTTAFDVPPNELIEEAAKELRKMKELTPPPWAAFVKTGASRERPPQRDDWWWVRAASILRTLYVHGPTGVERLRTKYGGRKKRGHEPEEFRKGSGAIIRKILQQLESAGLVEKIKKGRRISEKGRSFLDRIAARVARQIGIKV